MRVTPTARWWCDVDVVERAHRPQPRSVPADGSPTTLTASSTPSASARGSCSRGGARTGACGNATACTCCISGSSKRLTDHCLTRGDLARGLVHGNRLLQLDPAREVTHRQLMRLYAGAGDRTGALRQYRRCAQAWPPSSTSNPTPRRSSSTSDPLAERRVASPGGRAAPAPPSSGWTSGSTRSRPRSSALRNEVRLLVALQEDCTARPEGEWEAG